MSPALNWLRIMTPRAFCQTPRGMDVSGLAMNSRRMASHVSTRTTSSARGVRESLARTDALPNRAIRERVRNFVMAGIVGSGSAGPRGPADRLKHACDDLESADWRRFPPDAASIEA